MQDFSSVKALMQIMHLQFHTVSLLNLFAL